MCCDSLFSNDTKVNNINRIDFEKLLRAVLQNKFTFDGKIYKQIDGVAMGSPLGPTLANSFLCFHEQIWLDKCRCELKPVYYKRCVDDIFILFRSPDHHEKFKPVYYKRCVDDIFILFRSPDHHEKFKTLDSPVRKNNNSMSFSDVLITRTSNDFTTSVCHKPTFS